MTLYSPANGLLLRLTRTGRAAGQALPKVEGHLSRLAWPGVLGPGPGIRVVIIVMKIIMIAVAAAPALSAKHWQAVSV